MFTKWCDFYTLYSTRDSIKYTVWSFFTTRDILPATFYPRHATFLPATRDPRPLVKLVYPVFHFKRTVPKRIKNISKFSECWLVNSSVVRQKVDLRRTFHFDTRMDLSTSFQSTHAHQSISTGGVHIKNITKNIKRKKTKSTTICTLPKATVNHDGVSQNKYMIKWIQTRLLTSKILFYTTFK